jgi:Putative prokaryotic signal transducing protein
MYCPICRSEYQPGITRCPVDEVELVEQLVPESGDDSKARFVPLHNLASPVEAEMVNDIFQQNGIRSVIQSGSADALSPLLSSVEPGAAVLVDERDYDRALELYQAFFGEDTSPLTGGGGEEDEEDDETSE